ncbi:hypothetical protein L1785_18750 [Antribacter sp. KLBMP9083]|uniref:Uncharacterized protein n=1 Tax=Antribacter soli TaxID=2910976 RepID=A0AA41QGG3_9MICO|nr:hypothetical protein [Antribacter soli]MCF4123019.1 hypothetical protein [Antribacter soli]
MPDWQRTDTFVDDNVAFLEEDLDNRSVAIDEACRALDEGLAETDAAAVASAVDEVAAAARGAAISAIKLAVLKEAQAGLAAGHGVGIEERDLLPVSPSTALLKPTATRSVLDHLGDNGPDATPDEVRREFTAALKEVVMRAADTLRDAADRVGLTLAAARQAALGGDLADTVQCAYAVEATAATLPTAHQEWLVAAGEQANIDDTGVPQGLESWLRENGRRQN